MLQSWFIVIGMFNKEYRPTLAQLRTFATIAETRHFGTAAAKLGISQPSLSQALVALENGLGLQLIERSTRRVIVTQHGERLLPYAQSAIDAAETFVQQALGAADQMTGAITVGMIPTIAPFILPEFLARVEEEYPDLRIQLVEDQTNRLLTLLRDGHINVAFMALPVHDQGMATIKCYEEPLAVITPEDSEYAERDDLRLSDVKDMDILLLEEGNCLRDQVIDVCRQGNVDLGMSAFANRTKAANLTTVVQCVAAGMGTTLVPESSMGLFARYPGVAISHFHRSVTASREIGAVFRGTTSRRDDFEELARILREAYEYIISEEIPA